MLHITSSSSPVGSAVFSCIALVIISLVVLLILRYYLPLRTTPSFYLIPIFFALWLPTIVVILVPVDLASSAVTGDEATRGIWLPERVILVSWRISYWLTFALTWYELLVVCIALYANKSAAGLYSHFLPNTPTLGTENHMTNLCTQFEVMRSSTPLSWAFHPSDSSISTSPPGSVSRSTPSKAPSWPSHTVGD